MLIYDCEIKKDIAKKGEPIESGIEYCGGWRDFEGMGITVIGVYDYQTDRYRVFLEDNLSEFQDLIAQRELVVGFNNNAFDNLLCEANGLWIPSEKSYDLLVEIWAGAGLGPRFNPSTHGGFGLDACSAVNFGTQKSGNGALAPIDWQRGKYGSVIDYCLNDVKLTKDLMDLVLNQGSIICPKTNRTLTIRHPEGR